MRLGLSSSEASPLTAKVPVALLCKAALAASRGKCMARPMRVYASDALKLGERQPLPIGAPIARE